MNAFTPGPQAGTVIEAEFPEKLALLFRPSRYKVAHGGRGGGKSWGFARALLILGREKRLRVLCVREIMNSIDDSVHALLKDQIEALNFTYVDERGETLPFYRVMKNRIIGANGTMFIYAGLLHNINSIKSKEAIDIVWAEEAQTISDGSWRKLIPTIRKEGSEIWISFNPELVTDATYVRFIKNPPTGCVRAEINWRDNPWFPRVLLAEMRDDFERNYDMAMHVWEGKPIQYLEGAIYANEFRRADNEGRIGSVPYSPFSPVHTFWDLGWSDLTTIWFVQKVGGNYNLIDYWQGRKRTIEWIFTNVINHRPIEAGWGEEWSGWAPYSMGHYFLPHDADHGHLASNGKSVRSLVEAQIGDAGRVHVLGRLPIAQGINAARTIFSQCYFDETRCADGIQALRGYKYEVDPDTGLFSKLPEHDMSSHGADAFRQFALSIDQVSGFGDITLKLNPDGDTGFIKLNLGRSSPGRGWMGR